jgi:hypothetical protein
MSTSVKISQLIETPVIGPNDSLPIARGNLETFRTPARQFVSEGLNVGVGPGQLFALKSTATPTTLQFRTLSAVGENLAIATVGDTVVFEMSGQTPYKMTFFGEGNRTVWPLAPFNSVNAANYRVDIDGVLQEPFTDYSLSANQIIFTEAPYLSGKVVIVSSNVVRLNEAIVAPDSIETEMLRDEVVTPDKLSTGGPTWNSTGIIAVNTLSAQNNVLTSNLSATGNIFTPNRPMFSAQQVPYLSTNYISKIVPGNNTYIGSNEGWDTLNLLNVGNGFSITTGLFTAPVAGFYLLNFCQTIASTANHFGDIYFRRNNDGAILSENLVLRSTTTWVAGSLSIIIYMNIGDSIGPYIVAYSGAPAGVRGTQFNGFLVG